MKVYSKLFSIEDDQIIVSPFTKIRIEDQFSLKTIPIERPIKGFENISECYEVTARNKLNHFKIPSDEVIEETTVETTNKKTSLYN